MIVEFENFHEIHDNICGSFWDNTLLQFVM